MSSKSARKVNLPATSKVPRSLDEITKSYNEAVGQAGVLHYQIAVYQDDLKLVTDMMKSLNYEAAERKKLDEGAK